MENHDSFMLRCLELASKGKNQVSPNPMVGSVIVYENKIIGEGYHQAFGGPHAEVNAIKNVENKSLLKKATLYVNLEPCSHHGKTPPCCNTIVEYGIPNVVIGSGDPNEKVNGKGIDFLKKNNVNVINNILKEKAEELNRKFYTFHKHKRPHITLKWAETIDGYIDKNRKSSNTKEVNWITTENTKTLVHQWRSEHDAILVGRKTIENDNPSLTVRLVKGKNPLRIVIDPLLKLSNYFDIFKDEHPLIILNEKIDKSKGKIKYLKFDKNNLLNTINSFLYQNKIQSLLVEGGAKTIDSFLKEGNWDEAKVLIGNKKFSDGLLAPKIKASPISIKTHGQDKLISYRND
ncbi:MAG: riboflavin biosynthesis protein RibD [Crocinitomicaceae bacterium]|nr:riboflavin biosynthesis protein RibD [Crocinitomicaceae bacterium]